MRFSPIANPWFDRLAVAAMAVISFIVLATINFAPSGAGAAVAVIYAPWTPARDALIRATGAGARFVRYGGMPFIVVVSPENSDYSTRARASGALFTVDPRALAACLTVEKQS